MDVFSMVKAYRTHGFLPFPLQPLSKNPAVPSLAWAERGGVFHRNSNIGIFAGSPNGLVIVDVDDAAAKTFVTNRLVALGLYDWITIVETPKRKLNHFWLRLEGVPSNAQAFYKLPKEVGGGEVRLHRPAYVAAPGSVMAEGEYRFIQGSLETFSEQPILPFSDIRWLLPEHAYQKRPASPAPGSTSEKRVFPYNPNPPIARMFPLLRVPKGTLVHKVDPRTGAILPDTYPSRSEAELGLVMGLIRAGWCLEDIEERFHDEQPSHWAETKDPAKWLERAYESASRFISVGGRWQSVVDRR